MSKPHIAKEDSWWSLWESKIHKDYFPPLVSAHTLSSLWDGYINYDKYVPEL